MLMVRRGLFILCLVFAVGIGAYLVTTRQRPTSEAVPAPTSASAAESVEPVVAAPTHEEVVLPTSSAGQLTPPPSPASSAPATTAASKVTTKAAAKATTAAKPATTAPVVPVTGPQPGGRVDCSQVACVALTFDDGPNSSTTLQVVNALNSQNIPATFFMLGSMAQSNPSVVATIAANPRFEIGNHSVNHPNLTTLSSAQVSSQITSATATLTRLSGRRITLFRPPYGSHNATVDAACRTSGQAVILWSVDTLDWQNRNAATTTAKAVAGAKAGSIILMHDIHPSTAAAVPGLINQLRAKGFVLVTVSELLGAPVAGRTYTQRG